MVTAIYLLCFHQPFMNLTALPDNSPALIHIMLVEDDLDVQGALRGAIEAAPDMLLTCVVSTRDQGLQALTQPPVDVLLVDLGLPDGSGIDVIKAAHARWPGCAIMVSTTFGDEEHVLSSIEAGASGYLIKDSSPHRMVDEIRNLHAGGSPISPMIARQVLTRFRASTQQDVNVTSSSLPGTQPDGTLHDSLSEREHEVLVLITKGFKTIEIASAMQVSRFTVQSFVRRIYAKLEVNSKAEAIYEARKQGLLDS